MFCILENKDAIVRDYKVCLVVEKSLKNFKWGVRSCELRYLPNKNLTNNN